MKLLTSTIFLITLLTTTACTLSRTVDIVVNVTDDASKNLQIADQVIQQVIAVDLNLLPEVVPGFDAKRIQDIKFKINVELPIEEDSPVKIKISFNISDDDSEDFQQRVMDYLIFCTKKRLELYQKLLKSPNP